MKKTLMVVSMVTLPGMALAYDPSNPYFNAKDLNVIGPIYEEMTGDLAPSINDLRSIATDLDGDGEKEVLIKDKAVCTGGLSCRIVIGQFDSDDQKWRMIGDFSGYSVFLEERGEGYRDIAIDTAAGDRTYVKFEDGAYKRDLSRLGDPVVFSDAREAFKGKEDFLERVLARGLGPSYAFVQQAKSEQDGAYIAGADLNFDGDSEYLIYADYAAVCDGNGCPLLIFDKLGSRPFAVLHASSMNVVVSDEVDTGKLKSIFIEEGGYHWDGKYKFEGFEE